jgi:hypothetical protein
MSTPNTAQASTTVHVVAPIPVDVLCRLFIEYSTRLKEKTDALSNLKQARHSSLDAFLSVELQQDIQYLSSQVRKLVDKASTYHEYVEIDEGERFELELRLFDAEDVLRLAQRVLSAPNPDDRPFIRTRSKS